MRKITLALLAVIALCLVACTPKTSNKVFDPAQVNFRVEYNPIFDNCLYPSLLLGYASYTNAIEEQMQLFSATVTSPKDNAVMRIVIDSSALNYVTIVQEILPRRGETYTFYPIIKWKYDNLYATRKQGSIDISFTCYINDEEVDIKNLRLNYRSVNECLLSTRKKGRTYDYRWLFAGYVNEDHPDIEEILSDILDQGVIKIFNGYQSTEKQVTEQMKAIWYYALNRGIAYSSISCTSNPSNTSNVQHIRFFDEVHRNRQANCIDACVFFASIMRKIGLKPIIFVEPCHAYLGYYTDKKRKHVSLLETTITGWVNFPDLERSLSAKNGLLPEGKFQTISKYLTEQQKENYLAGKIDFPQLKRIISDSLFNRATLYNLEDYRKNKIHFEDTANITYQQLVIEDLRQLVQPIN